MDDTAQTLDPLDRIDRAIEIDASAERVWELVARPGWWINEGEVDAEPDLTVDGAQAVLRHPQHGVFRLETIESRPPTYLSYRWLGEEGDAGTLVEFTITPRDGGVTLAVAESGFSRLGKTREAWLAHREGNVTGWKTELEAAKAYVEGSA